MNLNDGGDDDDCDGSIKSEQPGCREIGDYCHRSPLSSDGSPTPASHSFCLLFTQDCGPAVFHRIVSTVGGANSLMTDHKGDEKGQCEHFISEQLNSLSD